MTLDCRLPTSMDDNNISEEMAIAKMIAKMFIDTSESAVILARQTVEDIANGKGGREDFGLREQPPSVSFIDIAKDWALAIIAKLNRVDELFFIRKSDDKHYMCFKIDLLVDYIIKKDYKDYHKGLIDCQYRPHRLKIAENFLKKSIAAKEYEKTLETIRMRFTMDKGEEYFKVYKYFICRVIEEVIPDRLLPFTFDHDYNQNGDVETQYMATSYMKENYPLEGENE